MQKNGAKLIKDGIFLSTKEREINTAIILCGGRGSRLGILGKKLPKTLVKINNRPILWYIINSLIKILLIILFFQQDTKVL